MKRATRNISMAGLATLVLFAAAGCQTIEQKRYEPNNYDQLGVYVDNNTRDHSAREDTLQGKNTGVYPTILNINF